MRCVRSATYFIVLNGGKGAEFKPYRGLRQEDPLSPYLFIICTEGFSRLLNLAKTNGQIAGAKIDRRGLTITQFFVDDIILFG